MRIRITNDFHNTEAVLVIRPPYNGVRLSPGQVARASKKLCGMDDCRCSGRLGHRGPQDHVISEVYDDKAPDAIGFEIFPYAARYNPWKREA